MESTTQPFILYSDKTWNLFCQHIGETEEEFKKKTYLHFDHKFNFLSEKEKIRRLVSDKTLEKVKQHSFSPFVKILTKSPRYRYNDTLKIHSLETKIRPIAFASHFDSYIYAYYSFALNYKYQNYIKDKRFDSCVLAYRTDLDKKCNIQFSKEVFDKVKSRLKENSSCVAIALDISGYFDNIEHQKLKRSWSKIIGVDELPDDQYMIFKTLTKYSYVNKNSILRHFDVDLKARKKKGLKTKTLLDLIDNDIVGSNFINKFNLLRERKLIVSNLPEKNLKGKFIHKGIPQGSPMSAVLSNIYLIEFDQLIYELSQKYDFTYRRYCDDLLIICDEKDSEKLNNLLLVEIRKYDLKIQDRKTEIVKFMLTSKGKIRSFNLKKIKADGAIISEVNEKKYYKNLQYLGFEFNGQKIYIRPSSVSRYFRKMKGRIVKTISMSYSKKSKVDKILKKQLYRRYSHLGERNFLTYALNASKEFYKNKKGEIKEGMNSKSIRKQVSKHTQILKYELQKTNSQRIGYKISKGKLRKKKF